MGEEVSHTLSGVPDLPDDDESRPAKRQRNFIARQACEACRIKKTRCDEDMPCGLCRSLGLECTYAERKPTKNEASLSMIFNALRRVESKIDHLSVPTPTPPRTIPDHEAHESLDPHKLTPIPPPLESPYLPETALSNRSIASPQSLVSRPLTQSVRPPSVLSFSAHQTVHWPGVLPTLPAGVAVAIRRLEASYPTLLESARPSLDPAIPAKVAVGTGDWLASLGPTCLQELSTAYFDTFNRIYPFLDRDHYFSTTLAVVQRDGFGHDMESCLVLNVMALGCMGLKAFEEGGFTVPESAPIKPRIRRIMDEEVAGQSFFNEARKRVGFCIYERDMHSCQYYLTSALFFAQTARPVDKWMMTTRAAVSCTAFFKCRPEPHDEWQADMQSRLFWSALLLETIIVQELELPPSPLKEYEDVVPLPTFTRYPYATQAHPRNADDAYFHYHFLAQIAHRIILSRIRDELFFSNPSTALADELRHQLEQWRTNLPHALQMLPDARKHVFDGPAEVVAVTLLQARYRVSIFHLGRPFLYKAIQNPAAATDTDLRMCADALHFAMDWPLAADVCQRMKNFMPLKYFASGQMFGQLFIFHAFKHSTDRRLRDALPTGYEVWCTKMLRFISELVGSSPTMASDFDLLARLYQLNDV